MNSVTKLTLVVLGAVGVLSREHLLSVSTLTVWDEACAGWLAWALLCGGISLYHWKWRADGHFSDVLALTSGGCWYGALSLLVVSAAGVAAQIVEGYSVLGFVPPLITLLIVFADSTIPPPTVSSHQIDLAQSLGREVAITSSLLDKSLWGSNVRIWIPTNLGLFLCLFGSSSYHEKSTSIYIYSLVFLLARTLVYTLLPRMSSLRSTRTFDSDYANRLRLFQGLSMFSLGSFTSLLALLSATAKQKTSVSISSIMVGSISQVLWWVSVFGLSTEGLSKTASTLETMSASLNLSLSNPSALKLVLSLTSAVGALWQLVLSSALDRCQRTWLCSTIFILLLGMLVLGQLWGSEKQNVDLGSGRHPVDAIVTQAQAQFSVVLARQSRTLVEATVEYSRRYGRQPPPHFDEWFKLAQQYEFCLVDEFDSLMQSLEPFWGVPPSTLRTLAENAVGQLPDQLIRYEISDRQISVSQGTSASWFRDAMAGWLPEEWAELVPNVVLAINEFDEPSVCVPHDVLEEASRRARSQQKSGRSIWQAAENFPRKSPRFLNIGKQDVWEAVTVSCAVQSSARKPICDRTSAEMPLGFIRNLTKSKDICEQCELQHLEGFLLTPETLELTHSLAPIWSQSKISSFSDIIFPSPYYSVRSGDYVESEDPNWESKDSQLYWVGAATGGHATDANWRRMQRQRLALMTATGSTEQIQLLHYTKNGLWTPYTTNMSAVPLFSTRIMGVTPQCDPVACEAQKAAFGVGNQEIKDPPKAAFTHKFLLDLDGNSFSGRYYRLLQSKSVVLKQTLFEEWHDDRLIPWVHFIPVSTSFNELPELMRFLATTERGEEIAARIAEESRNWTSKALRDVDMQLVWLRMLMEYGRIADPGRDS